MNTKPTLEQFQQEFEKHMLFALDYFVEKDKNCGINVKGGGWKDRDLEVILPTIRKHGEVLYQRCWNGGSK